MTLVEAVEQTVGALPVQDSDAALIALTRSYARALDSAAFTRRQAWKAHKAALARGDDELTELVGSLRAKLGERSALDRIGARLHSALTELQATPRSRPESVRFAGTDLPGQLRAVKG